MGDLHFYIWYKVYTKENDELCNALKGATFISTQMKKFVLVTVAVCQCPERGDLHFYSVPITKTGYSGVSVNALKGATFISTRSSSRTDW